MWQTAVGAKLEKIGHYPLAPPLLQKLNGRCVKVYLAAQLKGPPRQTELPAQDWHRKPPKKGGASQVAADSGQPFPP